MPMLVAGDEAGELLSLIETQDKAHQEKLRSPRQEPREALLIGMAPTLMAGVPYLLHRSGFQVDVVTTSSLLSASRFVREVRLVSETDAITPTAFALISDRVRPYDWVIAGDDQTLLELSGMDWPEDREPAYLPLRRPGELSHIYSKIGLSRVLEAAGVKTPPFCVAEDCSEALRGAHKIGYPVVLKTDADSGGAGVYFCREDNDVIRLGGLFADGPMLVQKVIEGREIDRSGIFFNGELVHFAHASIERASRKKKALSVVRRYMPLSLVDEKALAEMRALGRALQASGFVSIGMIEAADGSGNYFFEADMRPTLWVDVARLYGDDAAPKIRRWFEGGEVLRRQDLNAVGGREPMRIAHFLRLDLWEVLLNRYGVWRTIPWVEWRAVWILLGDRMWMPVVRTLVPRGLRQVVKRAMLMARIAFP